MNSQVKITLVGDIFPGERDFTLNYGIKSQFEKHNGKLWIDAIKSILGDNDIVIGNLESPLVYSNETPKKTFYGTPDFAFFLKKCNINVLNVSNNHILEHGQYGFESTLRSLNQANLGIVGNIADSYSKIQIVNVGNIKIGIAGFSNVDLHKIHNDNSFAVLNENNVLDSLSKMSQLAVDIKILCFHWGNEYVHFPSLEQRKMAYRFIDAGAHIIAGHHSHVIQPYEKYKNGHILYSMGNFMFDFLHSKKVRIGLITSLVITDNLDISVQLKGIKLSHKNIVESIPTREFEKYYAKISSKYKMYKSLSDTEYQRIYYKTVRVNRMIQRTLMKMSIVSEFLRLNYKDRLILFSNLVHYYYK